VLLEVAIDAAEEVAFLLEGEGLGMVREELGELALEVDAAGGAGLDEREGVDGAREPARLGEVAPVEAEDGVLEGLLPDAVLVDERLLGEPHPGGAESEVLAEGVVRPEAEERLAPDGGELLPLELHL